MIVAICLFLGRRAAAESWSSVRTSTGQRDAPAGAARPIPSPPRSATTRDLGYVVVSFGADLDLAIAPQNFEALARATPEELGQIEIRPSGLALRFPRLEAEVYLPPLLKGVHRSRR